MDCAGGCIQDWLAFSRPKPVFTVQNGINWDKPVFPVFSFQNWEKLSKTRKKSGTIFKWENVVVHGSIEGKVICAPFCSEWSIVGYGTSAFWDLWIKSIIHNEYKVRECLNNFSIEIYMALPLPSLSPKLVHTFWAMPTRCPTLSHSQSPLFRLPITAAAMILGYMLLKVHWFWSLMLRPRQPKSPWDCLHSVLQNSTCPWSCRLL